MTDFPWPLLLTPAVLGVLAAVRHYQPKIPGWVIVVFAPVLGLLLDHAAGQLVASWDTSGATAAALGMLATYFHQLGKQSMDYINDKPPAPPHQLYH